MKTTLPLAALIALLSGCGAATNVRRVAHYAGYRLGGDAPAADCWEGPSYRACAYKSGGGERSADSLVYFLHYSAGDEKSWNSIGLSRAFFKTFKKRGVPAPTVVSLSFGRNWLISAEQGQRDVVLLDDFVGGIMAAVEGRVGAPKKRYLWGMSMGAYNAAELAFRRPRLWNAAVLSCPALQTVNPFHDPERAAQDLANRTRSPIGKVRDGITLFRIRLKGPATWDAENPMALAGTASASVPIFIQASSRDEFGFLPGAEALDAALRAAGRPARLKVYRGGHCVFDAREAADYFIDDGGSK